MSLPLLAKLGAQFRQDDVGTRHIVVAHLQALNLDEQMPARLRRQLPQILLNLMDWDFSQRRRYPFPLIVPIAPHIPYKYLSNRRSCGFAQQSTNIRTIDQDAPIQLVEVSRPLSPVSLLDSTLETFRTSLSEAASKTETLAIRGNLLTLGNPPVPWFRRPRQ
jgi:hypothetical protein